jgi:hypothetical protein
MKPEKRRDLVNEFCSPDSVLIVNQKGIFRVKCPFKARCIKEVDYLQPGEIVTVIAVLMAKNLCLLYVVKNKTYYHRYFVIIGR